MALVFVPGFILFRLLKIYAYYDFSQIKKKHKEKSGKQKHNCFVKLSSKKSDEFRIGSKIINAQKRQIDLSLRKIVAENRSKIEPVSSSIKEEINLLNSIAE